ncbi:hypothetical protein M758_3G030600 [Ceratodon purpureus]|nr:hypothetical protein M758_3G030600 [Ceratodon purpureus]
MGETPGRLLRGGHGETLMQFLRGRWFVIAVGIVVMITSAGAYSFGIYSQKLKSVLNINQEQMNLVANFKDLGVNLGIHSGLLYDYWSPGGVLLVGSVEATVGYLLAWMALTKRLTPSTWQMCIFLFIGANSQPMFNTAVLVQAVKMFPSSRGVVISLMKGYIGISGAILIQVFVAIEGSKNPEAFLLLLVWLPSTVAILAMFVIRPNVKPFLGFAGNKSFYWYLALGFALAFYLMGVNIATNVTKVGIPAQRAIGAGLFVLLVAPLLAISYRSEFYGKKSLEPGLESPAVAPDVETAVDEKTKGSNLGVHNPGDETPETHVVPPEPAMKIAAWPKRGQDHTIYQALTSMDFWLLFVATVFGVGSGLTATDNMGQLGLSFGYSATDVSTFVSLLSIWNSIGRWVGGFLSDYLLYRYGFPRTQFQTIALLTMAVAYLLLALNVPACLYYGSILLGLSFGTQYPIYTTIVAEEFGLRRFATLYNCLNISCSIGNYILSGPVAGRFYDHEAKKQAVERHLVGSSAKLVCDGAVCFRRTCITLMAVSIGAAGFAGLLWYRTRGFYSELSREARQQKLADHSALEAQEADHSHDIADNRH